MPSETRAFSDGTPSIPEIVKASEEVVGTITARQQEAVHAVELAGTVVLDGLTRTQREIMDFVSERIRQDIEGQQDLLRCQTLEDVRGVQTRFFRTAMEQYSAEATRLMRLGGEIVTRSIERFPH